MGKRFWAPLIPSQKYKNGCCPQKITVLII